MPAAWPFRASQPSRPNATWRCHPTASQRLTRLNKWSAQVQRTFQCHPRPPCCRTANDLQSFPRDQNACRRASTAVLQDSGSKQNLCETGYREAVAKPENVTASSHGNVSCLNHILGSLFHVVRFTLGKFAESLILALQRFQRSIHLVFHHNRQRLQP
jgi:hypothetical protein